MEETKTKICDLEIAELSKAILTLCNEPKRMVEIVAKLDKNYNYVSTSAAVLVEKGYLKKISTLAGKVLYELNKDRLTL